jgi:serine/threonine protein kinase
LGPQLGIGPNYCSGGQASAKYLRDRATGRTAFLKILSRQKDLERRARFFREATAYETANHKLIPKLIESNAHRHSNPEFTLFLLTDFIEGPTLAEFINSHGRLSFDDATTVLRALLEVVEYCHTNGWIHRDIKPDNIILQS